MFLYGPLGAAYPQLKVIIGVSEFMGMGSRLALADHRVGVAGLIGIPVVSAVLMLSALLMPSTATAIEPDPSFGTAGRSAPLLLPTVKRGKWETVDAVVRFDGSVVVLLRWRAGPGFTLASFAPDGSLNPAFGVGGRVSWRPQRGGFYATSVDSYPDGDLAVGGVQMTKRAFRADVIRFSRSAGRTRTMRTTTGTTASDSHPLGGVHVVVDDRRRTLAAVVRHGALRVSRFDGSGRLDRSFGRRGTARLNYPGSFDGEVISVTPTADEGIAVVAFFVTEECDDPERCPAGGEIYGDQVLARFTKAGRAVRRFGDRGFVNIDRSFELMNIDVHSNTTGEYLVTGSATVNRQREHDLMVALKFSSAGRQDKSFGETGELFDPIAETPGAENSLFHENSVVSPQGAIWSCGLLVVKRDGKAQPNVVGYIQRISPVSAGTDQPDAADIIYTADLAGMRCANRSDESLTSVGLNGRVLEAMRVR